MRFTSRNVCGLNKDLHLKEVQHFICTNNIDFMGLLETKVKVQNALGTSKNINKNWKWLFNYDHNYNGRVWVGWNPNVWVVFLHSMSAQHITC